MLTVFSAPRRSGSRIGRRSKKRSSGNTSDLGFVPRGRSQSFSSKDDILIDTVALETKHALIGLLESTNERVVERDELSVEKEKEEVPFFYP